MAHESIYDLKRPGFPKESYGKDAYRTVIEYVGIHADLIAASPAMSSAWGEYPGLVTDESIFPLDGTDYGIMTIVVERKYGAEDGGGSGLGTLVENETTYEIEWNDVQRSYYEHPKFRIGGGGSYELTSEDVAAIEKWKVQPNPDYKKDYIYDKAEVGDHAGTLSTNAQMFARGVEIGSEYWVDKAPLARRTDTYVLGPPPAGTAGQKETPSGFPNLPTGYEWIRNADRAIRAGGQSTWANVTDWIGAKKVLADVDEIFWDAP